MSTACHFLHPLQRDGTSQRQRLLEALKPSYVSVDERELADLLLYARKYAELLRYYTPTNGAGGNWVEFIAHDASTLVSLIATTDPKARKDEFTRLRDAVLAADPADKPAAYAKLFTPMVDLARTFDQWFREAVEGLTLRATLRRLIGSALSDALRDAMAQAFRAAEVGLGVDPIDTTGFSDAWAISGVRPDPSLFPSGGPPAADEELDEAARRAALVFDHLHEPLVFIVRNAPTYLEETLERHPEHQPHMALFLAFLNVFKHAQQHLNTLTAKHLDFYYKEVLKLGRRPPVPDRVHVFFELAKSFATHRLRADTVLKAGKDATGVELLYATDGELVVNRAKLHEEDGLKTVFVEKDEGGFVRGVFAAPDADSADGLGAEIEDEEGKWDTLGSKKMPYARLGFAVASPMFWLAEGTRVVTLKLGLLPGADFLCDKDAEDDVEAELEHNVKVHASGEKEWLPVLLTHVVVEPGSESETPRVDFTLELGAEAAPIVAYDPAVLDGGFDTEHPVLRFLLDSDGLSVDSGLLGHESEIVDYSDDTPGFAEGALVRYEGEIYKASVSVARGYRPVDHPEKWERIERSHPYKYFQRMEVASLTIDLDVDGVRGLILENDVGLLDPAKPFHPFGQVPKVGGGFLVGSQEVFQKALSALDLHITWPDLPDERFEVYYSQYDEPPKNADFKVKLQILRGGIWIPDLPSYELFGTNNETPPDPSVDLSITTQDLGTFGRDASLRPFARFETTLRRGFLRLVLETSFRHREYPTLLAAAAASQGGIPNPPYTPLMSSFTLDYAAEETVEFSQLDKSDFPNRVERLFQIGPFGQREVFPIADDSTAQGVPINRKLVPEFTVIVKAPGDVTLAATAEGTLYLGIEGLEPPQNLSLLFQVAEGSEDPTRALPPVVWSHLSAGRWVDFQAVEIISDGTKGLLRSGVVKLAMPKTMTKDETLLPAGLHWIKASARERSVAIPRLIAVHPQAEVASFRDQGNDPAHLSRALPAGAIAKLQSREAAIKSVGQPYASFGGRMQESNEAFYFRVSERLRHKGRALSIFDYERLVLERFPDVYKVKCISHTRTCSEYAPGHVKLVVVPNLRNKNAVDPLQPRLSVGKLEEIRAYLSRLASDFVTLEVASPDYEEVQVHFKVRFHSGRDRGLYTAELQQEIVRFLSPWLHDEGADLAFGGRVLRSAILNHVEEREYVDFVTEFRMYHIVGGEKSRDVDEARATKSSAALVSAREHIIEHDVVSCEDRETTEPPPTARPGPPAKPPAQDVPPAAGRYLGNTSSRELHDLLAITAMCQIDEIPIDRRYHFRTIADAVAMGYDYCAYCFSRGLSQR